MVNKNVLEAFDAVRRDEKLVIIYDSKKHIDTSTVTRYWHMDVEGIDGAWKRLINHPSSPMVMGYCVSLNERYEGINGLVHVEALSHLSCINFVLHWESMPDGSYVHRQLISASSQDDWETFNTACLLSA